MNEDVFTIGVKCSVCSVGYSINSSGVHKGVDKFKEMGWSLRPMLCPSCVKSIKERV